VVLVQVLSVLCIMSFVLVNPLAYTAVRETAGLARSVNTQPAVRRSEPLIFLLLILAFCQ